MKRFSKLLAALLSAIIITQSYTTVTLAAEQPQANDQTTSTSVEAPGVPANGSQTSANAQIVSEVVSKRTENTKTFLRDDGTYILASYDEPIHYKDSNGNWQEIGRTLTIR